MGRDVEYYMNLSYIMKVTKSEDGYLVEIPDLPGCMTVVDHPQDAREQIRDAARSWIEARLKRGLSIPEPKDHIVKLGEE